MSKRCKVEKAESKSNVEKKKAKKTCLNVTTRKESS